MKLFLVSNERMPSTSGFVVCAADVAQARTIASAWLWDKPDLLNENFTVWPIGRPSGVIINSGVILSTEKRTER